jgi:hypothetical protein
MLPSSSFADFRYDESTKITGGSLVSMTKFASAFSKQGRQLTDPVNSTILVKGNRMAHINPDSTEIIDLDQETITTIDNAKKQYSVVTFQEMKAAMEEAARKAQAQPQQAPGQQPASATPPPELKFKVTVTNTGATKQVAGLSATESILKMSVEATNQQSGQTGAMAMTNDMWMAPEIPGYVEVRDFNSRMAVKMGTIFTGAMPSPQMLSAQPGMFSGMADMTKEMSKLKGVPVSQVMRMGTTADGSPLPAASEAPLPPSNGPNGGAIASQAATNAANSAANTAASNAESQVGSHMGSFGGVASSIGGIGSFGGFHKKKSQPAAQPPAADGTAPTSAVLMESTTEMTNFSSASVDPALFNVPAGYARVASAYQKSQQ